MNTNYQSEYKKSYKEKNKIVTFPLSNPFFNELKRRAIILDLNPNTYAKNIVTSFLNNNVPSTMTQEQKEFIREYIHISRGIANNINQIAYKSNIDEVIDIKSIFNVASDLINKKFIESYNGTIISVSQSGHMSAADFVEEKTEIAFNNTSKRIVINHTYAMKLSDIMVFSRTENVEDFIGYFDKAHLANKNILKDILTEEVKEKISLV